MPLPPPIPYASFFQPVANFAELAALGVTVLCGPELGNPPITDQAKWSAAAAALGLSVVLKNVTAPVPPNCVGFMLSADEPNGKGILPSALIPNRNALLALAMMMPIHLSLAGDRILSANFDRPAEAQLYRDYAAEADVLHINFYSMNRNAFRYPTHHTGTIVKKLVALTGKPVWAWIECNDQQLDAPPAGQGTNRGPTPQEILDTADYALQMGAAGIGLFSTCAKGKYGWPASYLPKVDRNGASMEPQLAACKALGARLRGAPQPVPVPDGPTVAQRLDKVETVVQAQAGVIMGLAGQVQALTGRLDAMVRAGAAI